MGRANLVFLNIGISLLSLNACLSTAAEGEPEAPLEAEVVQMQDEENLGIASVAPPEPISPSMESSIDGTENESLSPPLAPEQVESAEGMDPAVEVNLDPLANCSADTALAPSVLGEVTFDPRTCLMWQFAHKDDVDIAERVDEAALGFGDYVGSSLDAEAECEQASTGGYLDWRLPDAAELIGSLINCESGEHFAPIELSTRLATTDIREETASAYNPAKICVHNQQNGTTTEVRAGAGVRCVRGGKVLEVPTPCQSCY